MISIVVMFHKEKIDNKSYKRLNNVLLPNIFYLFVRVEPGKRTILNHAVDRSIIVYGFACVPARGYLSGDYSLFYDTTNLE